MEIIFDEKIIKASGDPKSTHNHPDALVERFRTQLELLGNFIGADKVEYEDSHKKESYIITKEKKVLTLTAYGNALDGGWLGIEQTPIEM
jgi:hypothetical protein